MIFYYSGTGNSRWIAQTIAVALGDTAVNMVGADPKSYFFGEGEYLGLVYPVYVDAAPPPVLAFARQLEPNGAYTFAVSNYANASGFSLQQLSQDCLRLNSGYGMFMPDNTRQIGKRYDNEDSTVAKLKLAPYWLNQIIARLLKKEDGVFDAVMGQGAEHKTKTRPGEYWGTKNLTAPFSVTKSKCISCEMCARLCPSKSIEMIDGYPAWTNPLCDQCMTCICYCPTEAIEFGDKSQGVYRYTFEKYFPKAMTEELAILAETPLQR